MSFPALPASGGPWVRIVSCNPAEIKDPDVPPHVLRLPGGRPRGLGRVPRGVPRARTPTCTPTSTRSAASAARPALPDLEFIHESPYLNLYLYPRRGRLRARRAARRHLAQPAGERARDRRAVGAAGPGDGPLVYLSLGSLGSGDVELMRTLIDSLAGSAATASSSPRARSTTSSSSPAT